MKQLALIIVIFAIGIPCQAEMSGQEVITKCFALYRQTPSECERTEVTITPDGGKPTGKAFTRWIMFNPAGEDKVVVKFNEPAMDKGLGLLIWRHADEDEQWLKMPSFDKTRKIAVADQSKYFGGTDVTFEDARQLIGERTQDFNYKILSSDSAGWKIEALPKAGTKTGYGKRIFFVRSDFACTAIEYYDSRGELLKKQGNSEIKMQASGMWRTDKVIIVNRTLKRTTELTVTAREFGSVDESTFTQNFLLRKD
ncbi:MAG: outer membrane lipoprotein-sorting protein [Patescibacteria group bacterium]